MQSPKVLIVGAGPSGLIAALSLLKNGVSVRIIEKDQQHHQGFRGSGVMPRTQESEYFLGVLDDIKKYWFKLSAFCMYDPSDPYKVVRSMNIIQEVEPTPAFPLANDAPRSSSTPSPGRPSGSYRAPRVKVELGTSATTLIQDEGGVTVDIEKTSGGVKVKEQSRFDYVIGTDGGHSTIRKALGIKFLGETREDEKSYLADVRVKGFTQLGIHNWGTHGVQSTFLMYAGETGRYQMALRGSAIDFASLNAKKDVQTLQSHFRKVSQREDIEIVEVLWQAEWRPNIRLAERFCIGRVFIAGDAAHAHSPSGGQGLNSSIADTFNLSWKLALVLKGLAPASLLDSYELERIPIISEMMQISTSLHNKTMQQAVAIVKARSQEQEDAAAVKWKKEDDGFYRGWRLFQLDLNYRHSPLIVEDRYTHTEGEKGDVYGVQGHDIRGGDRAPDAPGLITVMSGAGDGKSIDRIFDLFDPTKHTVLVFSSEATEAETHTLTRSALSALGRLAPNLVQTALVVRGDATDPHAPFSGLAFVLKDKEGHAFRNYDLEDGKSAIVVVRPDAYIGAFVSEAAGVEKYLSLIFGPA